MLFNKIFNNNCFDVFPKIPEKSVDLVLVDLPYGQTACEWDVKIDLQLMWKNLKKICKVNCIYVFFTTTKFGVELINSKPHYFRYDLVWEKHNSIGFLSANKMPLRSHEMIYIFSTSTSDDIELNKNLELRAYAKKVYEYINKSQKQIDTDFGNSKTLHFFSFRTSQFSLPTKETYNKLIELYHIDKMDGFINHDKMETKMEKAKMLSRTYNPQKTHGKPYKVKAHKTKDAYGQEEVPEHENKTGDRHPRSIIKCNQSDEKLHPTQKPSDLCEWLIKTYSNENDVVLDFCMGSGSTIIAAINTNRKYIGIEKDQDIYEVAKKRINRLLNDSHDETKPQKTQIKKESDIEV